MQRIRQHKGEVPQAISFSTLEVVQFPVDFISCHDDFQPRERISQSLVTRYSENLNEEFLEDGKLSMPPIEILRLEKEDYDGIPIEGEDENEWEENRYKFYLIHGHHRYEACKKACVPEIPAKVYNISWSDAVKLACQANIFNGFQLTRKELKVAAMRYISQPQGENIESDRAIARRFGISPKSIRNYRSELTVGTKTKGWKIGETQLIHVDYLKKKGYERMLGRGTYLGIENYQIVVAIDAAFVMSHYKAYPVECWEKTDEKPIKNIDWNLKAGDFCFAIVNGRGRHGVILDTGKETNEFDERELISFDSSGFAVDFFEGESPRYLVCWFVGGFGLIRKSSLIGVGPFVNCLRFKYDYWNLSGDELRSELLKNLANHLEVTDRTDRQYEQILQASKWLGNHSIGGDCIESTLSDAEKAQLSLPFEAKVEKTSSGASASIATVGKKEPEKKLAEKESEVKSAALEVVSLDSIDVDSIDASLALLSDKAVAFLYQKLADELAIRGVVLSDR